MNGEPSWVIQTEDLQIGASVSFDLLDSNGQVLHKAGMPISHRVKELLKKRNIDSVTVRGAAEVDLDHVESTLVSFFPTNVIRTIQICIDTTQKALITFAERIRTNRASNVDELRGCVDLFVNQASKNVAATLALIALRSKNPDLQFVEKIARQSTQVALLSVVMSVADNDDPTTAFNIGLAATLHDTSLLLHPDWFTPNPEARDEVFWDEYRRHPIESAELLFEIRGIPRDVITTVTQVHEQADGTGYPRGLRLEQTMRSSIVVGLANAYFSLTEPIQGSPIIPADAMAYLCYHTSQGKFCKDMMQRMIECMSIYPVGSGVELSDGTKAVVIEGNADSPLQPTVRLLQNGNTRLDLRQCTKSIASPLHAYSTGKNERLSKSKIQEIRW